MSTNLLMGRDVRMKLLKNGVLLQEITDIKDFNWQMTFETVREQHLGKSGPSIDEVPDGCAGSFNCNDRTGAAYDLMFDVNDRASNRTPGLQVDLSWVYDYPSGSAKQFTLVDMKFKPFMVSVPGRKQHVTIKIDFENELAPLSRPVL